MKRQNNTEKILIRIEVSKKYAKEMEQAIFACGILRQRLTKVSPTTWEFEDYEEDGELESVIVIQFDVYGIPDTEYYVNY